MQSPGVERNAGDVLEHTSILRFLEAFHSHGYQCTFTWTMHYENNSGSLCSVENDVVVYTVGKYSTEH